MITSAEKGGKGRRWTPIHQISIKGTSQQDRQTSAEVRLNTRCQCAVHTEPPENMQIMRCGECGVFCATCKPKNRR